ncbi:MAG: YciI family protein [Gammaproteobacteria bacterium]
MIYSIISEDKPDSFPLRKANRPAHLARLTVLRQQGRLILAGPNPAIDSEDPGTLGFTGSIIVAEFNSLDEAEKWANDDPYVHAGVYETVTIKPFRKVLP